MDFVDIIDCVHVNSEDGYFSEIDFPRCGTVYVDPPLELEKAGTFKVELYKDNIMRIWLLSVRHKVDIVPIQ
jgi:hypothetical protein